MRVGCYFSESRITRMGDADNADFGHILLSESGFTGFASVGVGQNCQEN